MKYRLWYDALIARAHGRVLDGYSERHHVVPRTLGGSNDSSNVVRLTYREHFLAHWLLTKFTYGWDRKRMLHALHRMGHSESKGKGVIVAGWQYAVARKAQREAILGSKRSPETRAKMSIAQTGNTKAIGNSPSRKSRQATAQRNRERVFTSEIRAKMRAGRLGKTASPEALLNMAAAQLGRTHQPETIAKMKRSHLGNTYAKGTKHSAESRANMSAAQKANAHVHRANMLGRVRSDATREKVSQAKVKYWAEHSVTPGLSYIRRKNGTRVPYWVVQPKAREAGFKPLCVNLSDVNQNDIAATCVRLQAASRAFLNGA